MHVPWQGLFIFLSSLSYPAVPVVQYPGVFSVFFAVVIFAREGFTRICVGWCYLFWIFINGLLYSPWGFIPLWVDLGIVFVPLMIFLTACTLPVFPLFRRFHPSALGFKPCTPPRKYKFILAKIGTKSNYRTDLCRYLSTVLRCHPHDKRWQTIQTFYCLR